MPQAQLRGPKPQLQRHCKYLPKLMNRLRREPRLLHFQKLRLQRHCKCPTKLTYRLLKKLRLHLFQNNRPLLGRRQKVRLQQPQSPGHEAYRFQIHRLNAHAAILTARMVRPASLRYCCATASATAPTDSTSTVEAQTCAKKTSSSVRAVLAFHARFFATAKKTVLADRTSLCVVHALTTCA